MPKIRSKPQSKHKSTIRPKFVDINLKISLKTSKIMTKLQNLLKAAQKASKTKSEISSYMVQFNEPQISPEYPKIKSKSSQKSV